MVSGDYVVNNLYQSGASSFNPSIQNVPHYLGKAGLVSAGQMGMTTDPRTANQLAELSNKLNQGVIPMEIGVLGGQEWETIPTEHFHEMRRKANLAGAKISLHAPVQGMDPAGFGERGWEESQQLLVENQLKDVVDKAAIIDTEKNMPITIHGSNYHGSTWKMVGEGKDRKKEYNTLMAVDVENGQAIPIKKDIKYYAEPNMDSSNKLNFVKKREYSPEKQLEIQNRTKWDDSLQKIEFQRENADRIMKDVDSRVQAGVMDGSITQDNPAAQNALNKMHYAEEYLQEASREAQLEFNRAYTIAKQAEDTKQIDKLNKISKRYAESLNINEKGKASPSSEMPFVQSQAIGKLVQELRYGIKTPEQFVKVEDFATKKASDTFSNVAWHSYKEYGEGAPVVSIENLDQGRFGFSQGEDLARLTEESRKKFVKIAMKDENKKMTRAQAERAAKKMIGVTFDVGHLNISKKFGFRDEDLVKEAERIKKYVKHVHLTDNFGYADSHLPIGMGNVPVKKLLEAIGDEGKRARKINEVGGWFQFFKDSPFPQLLQATGSPIYSASTGPYWTQSSGFQQSYSSGAGMMLPSTHYSMFGAGFSQLPTELGGSVGGEGGRMNS